jgi:excisionase family DNA binding protein
MSKSMSMSLPQELLTPKELAQQLKVSQVSIYRWAREKVIPSYRATPKGRLRFDLVAVKAALAQSDQ